MSPKEAWSKVHALFRRRAMEDELEEEIRSHIELATEDLIARGVPAEQARRLARVEFGGSDAAKEAHRDARALAWIDGLSLDVRFALRGLRRDFVFAATAVLMLALAIGLNVTAFAIGDTMLFRGFPHVKHNDRILYVQERNPLELCCLSYPDFKDWQAQSKSFQGLAFESGAGVTVTESDGSRPFRGFGATLTSNAFGLLGVGPILGRDFAASDEGPGAAPVLMLSHHFWVSHFGRRSDIIGHSLRVDGRAGTVIGVMPEGFDFPEEQNFWMPLQHTPELEKRSPGGYMAFGRLADGATVAEARAELETINRRLALAYPESNRGVVPRVNTFSRWVLGPDAAMIYGSLWAAAWFVLLIACANLANLTLARTVGRSHEFSTRLALGAGPWRMARQIFAEGVLLAGAGGLLGWWITKTAVHTWAATTASRYQILDYTLDKETVLYLMSVSLCAAALFSVIPTIRIWRMDAQQTLRAGGRGVTQGPRARFLSRVLVAAQMALAVVLLAGAGVLVRSFVKLVTSATGIAAPEQALIGAVELPPERYETPDSVLRFYGRLNSALLALPGVEAASLASSFPVGSPGVRKIELEGRPPEPAGLASNTVLAAPDYFRVLGAAILSGREFTNMDAAGAPRVAIVNQAFAAKYWPGQNPIGKRLRVILADRSQEWRSVVGLSTNILQGDPTRQRFLPVLYLPLFEAPPSDFAFLARTRGPAKRLVAAVRGEIENLDPDLKIESFSTVQDSFGFRAGQMDIEHVEMGKHAAVAPIFAGVALLLAAVGLYAVSAHSVGQRTQEIGVRMAIGADRKEISGMILLDGMTPVAAGLAAGLTLALGLNRVLASQLIGVSPWDPMTMLGAPVVLVLIALLGCQIPARRATRVDPAVALRHE